jgi:glutamyl-tRNA synthetase
VIQTIRKFALANALEFGKASAGSVVGKVVAENPDAKADMRSLMAEINKQVEQVNTLSNQEIEGEIANYSFKPKPIKEEAGLSLPDAVVGKVVTRFPPEPSAHPHIGHAKAAFLNYELAKKYEGKFIIRWDDTNPENESEEFVGAIREGLAWLGIIADEESYASDDLSRQYDLAEQLIRSSGAYVCTCPPEKVKESREKKIRCECFKKPESEQLADWGKMVDGQFEEGQAILRFVGYIESQNTAMRDPSLFRIIKTKHYRQGDKYSCWPTYDFDGAVEDSLTGVTHALRSKEYELRDELYAALLDKLGLRKPYLYDFSRLNLKGTLISKRLLKPLIAENKVWGWDDPRLPTLAGLKRRGILPQALKTFVLSFGLSKVESKPGWDALINDNRKLLDPVALRFFFVENPVALKVNNAPSNITSATLKTHPTIKNSPLRTLKITDSFWISGSDASSLNVGEVFRLKDLYNVKLVSTENGSLSAEFESEKGPVEKKIQWLPQDENQSRKAFLYEPLDLVDSEENFNPDSLKEHEGLVEAAALSLPQGSFVQFERVAFARIDDSKKAAFIQCG